MKRPPTCMRCIYPGLVPIEFSPRGLTRCKCQMCKRAWAAHDRAIKALRSALADAADVGLIDALRKLDAIDLVQMWLGGEPSCGITREGRVPGDTTPTAWDEGFRSRIGEL